MKIDIVPIETERLIIRKFRQEDESDYVEYVRQEEGQRFSPSLKIPTIEEATKWFVDNIKQYKKAEPRILWAVELKDERKVIGAIAIEEVASIHKLLELGDRFNVNYWNKGYATEALRAMINHIFKNWDIDRIEVTIWKGNIGSERVCEKLGFVKEGILRQSRRKGNEIFDQIVLSLLRSEWKK